jgi:RNase P subunit RPR2
MTPLWRRCIGCNRRIWFWEKRLAGKLGKRKLQARWYAMKKNDSSDPRVHIACYYYLDADGKQIWDVRKIYAFQKTCHFWCARDEDAYWTRREAPTRKQQIPDTKAPRNRMPSRHPSHRDTVHLYCDRCGRDWFETRGNLQSIQRQEDGWPTRYVWSTCPSCGQVVRLGGPREDQPPFEDGRLTDYGLFSSCPQCGEELHLLQDTRRGKRGHRVKVICTNCDYRESFNLSEPEE